MFTKGQFVEWTSEDAEGKFTHVGEVVDYSVVSVIIAISQNGSTITIPQNDGTLKLANKPKDWHVVKPAVKVEKPEPIAKPTIKRERSSAGESKADKALDIYKSMMVNGAHPARSDVIKAFVEQLNMTQAGASTYQYNCKKALSK